MRRGYGMQGIGGGIWQLEINFGKLHLKKTKQKRDVLQLHRKQKIREKRKSKHGTLHGLAVNSIYIMEKEKEKKGKEEKNQQYPK